MTAARWLVIECGFQHTFGRAQFADASASHHEGSETMTLAARTSLIVAVLMLISGESRAEPLEHIGKPVRGIPVSSAVKVGKSVFVSGMPAFDANGKLAVGDFPAQMKQVMANLTGVLKAAGTDWTRVVKTNVLLMRASDFAEMNRIYGSYFPEGKFPARTTVVVAGLPHPDFLLEIECWARSWSSTPTAHSRIVR